VLQTRRTIELTQTHTWPLLWEQNSWQHAAFCSTRI